MELTPEQSEIWAKVQELDPPPAGQAAEGVTIDHDTGMVMPESGEKKQSSAEKEGMKKLIAMIAVGLFMFLSWKLGPHWKLEESESQELSDAMWDVLDYYGATMNVGPWGSLMAVSIGIMAPRIAVSMENKKEGRKQENNESPETDHDQP